MPRYRNVTPDDEAQSYRAGDYRCSYVFVWYKSQLLALWLDRVGAARVKGYVSGDERVFGTIEGWRLLKCLEEAVEYHCLFHGVVCEALLHEGLKAYEGQMIRLEGDTKGLGVVTRSGEVMPVYRLLKTSHTSRGRLIPAWSVIDEVTVMPW